MTFGTTTLDEDLSSMYLTEKHRGILRAATDHDEAEILLGMY